MIAAQLTVVVLSLIVLAAHFLRSGNIFLVAGVLIVAGLLFVRRAWVARLAQVTLGIGVIEWIWTLVVDVNERVQLGKPYVRLVIILGSVAAFTALGAAFFEGRRLGRLYRLDEDADESSG